LHHMITTLLARITPACKDVTHLASQSLDRPLPWTTRLKLHLHYWICEGCAQYRRQLVQVRKALRHMATSSSTPEQDDSQLSRSAKARLKDAFRSKTE
jgi:hypothetical protein